MTRVGFGGLFLAVMILSGCGGVSLLERLQTLPPAPPRCPDDVALPQALAPGQGGAGSEAPRVISGGPGFTARVERVSGDDRWTCGGCAVAWAPGGAELVSVGGGGALVWDRATGEARREVAPLPDVGEVGAVALSQDMRRMAYASKPLPGDTTRQVILVDLETSLATDLGAWPGGELFFSPDGETLVAGQVIFDVAAAAPVWEGIAASDPEGRRCAARPELVAREEGLAWRPAPPCPALRWLGEGRVALEVQALDVARAQGVARPRAFALALVARDGRELARLIEVEADPARPTPPRAFLDATRRRVALWSGGLLRIWGLPGGEPLAALELARAPDWVDLSADGARLVASWNPAGHLLPGGQRRFEDMEGRPAIQVWDVAAQELRWEAGPEQPARGLLHGAFSPDGAWLVGRDPWTPGTLRVLDAATGEVRAELPYAPEHLRPTAEAVLVTSPYRFTPLRLPGLEAPPRAPRVVAASLSEAVVIDHHDNLLRLGSDGSCALLCSGGASGLRQIQLAPSGRVTALTEEAEPRLLTFAAGAAGALPLPAGAVARVYGDELWVEDPATPGRVERVALSTGEVGAAWQLPRLPVAGQPPTRPALLYDLDPGAGVLSEPSLAFDAQGSAARVWPLGPQRGVVKRVETPSGAAVTALATLPEARAVLVGDARGEVLAMDLERLLLNRLASRMAAPVVALTAAPGRGGFVVAADAAGGVAFLDRRSGAELARLDLHPRYDAAEHIACALDQGRCALWTRRGARIEVTLEIGGSR